MNTPEAPVRPRNIDVQYDGTLSEHLVWELGTLAQAEQVMDLRSTVVIKTGNERPQVDTTSMGDILAWKALGDPREMFRRQGRSNRELVVKDSPYGESRADIVINDQVLSYRIRKENGNRLDERKYTAALNRYVASGLWEVATREKWHTAKLVTVVNAIDFGFPGAFVFLGFESIKFATRFNIGIGQPEGNIYLFGGGLIVGINAFFTAAGMAVYAATHRRELVNKGYVDIRSYADLNPLKHLGKIIDSAVYFSNPRRKFVTYEPKDH